jgi:hypothetical protein
VSFQTSSIDGFFKCISAEVTEERHAEKPQSRDNKFLEHSTKYIFNEFSVALCGYFLGVLRGKKEILKRI